MSTILGAPSPISDHLVHSASHAHAYAHTHAPPLSPHNPHSYDRFYCYMNPSPPVQYTHTQPHHGTKRSAPDDEFESPANNISTHFKKLRLNQAHLPHPTTLSPVGVSLRANNNTNIIDNHASSHITTEAPYTQHATAQQDDTSMQQHFTDETQIHPPSAQDFMPIDETPNRIYISDLDSEIAAIEASESKNITTFLLPDFDKNVSRIPQNVLRSGVDALSGRGGGSGPDDSQALVLYRDPVSISVPPEEDVVRKAIIESRRIAREKMRREYEEQYRPNSDQGGLHHDMGVAGGITGLLHTIHEVPSHDDEVTEEEEIMDDPDAMDIE